MASGDLRLLELVEVLEQLAVSNSLQYEEVEIVTNTNLRVIEERNFSVISMEEVRKYPCIIGYISSKIHEDKFRKMDVWLQESTAL